MGSPDDHLLLVLMPSALSRISLRSVNVQALADPNVTAERTVCELHSGNVFH